MVYIHTQKTKKKKGFFDSLKEGYSNPIGFRKQHSEIFEVRLEDSRRVPIQNI